MPSFKVTFAKIVGSPTSTHWSQVYSAGSLFAVLSLAKEDEKNELSLSVAGKGILNNIEAEFFTLEEKSLSTIKEALRSALTSTPEDIAVSLAFGYVKQDVLYLFVVGSTSALVKRGDHTATILKGEEKPATDRTIHASSGHIKDGDRFLLHTHSFAMHVAKEDMDEALAASSATDAEEVLTPHIHNKEAGDAAAILLILAGSDMPTHTPPPPETPPEVEYADEREVTKDETPDTPDEDSDLPRRIHEPLVDKKEAVGLSEAGKTSAPRLPRFSIPNIALPKKRLLILALAVILAITLGGSIYAAQQNREQQKIAAAYMEVQDAAQKDFEVGESLEQLNKAVAQDSFLKAQKTLTDNRSKFKEGTKEREELEAFLAKVTSKLGGDASQQVATKEADDAASPALAALKKNGVIATTTRGDAVFSLTNNAIMRVEGNDEEEVYKNDDDWSKPAGIGAFGSNLYVLDREEGVLKLAASAGGYGASNYFAGDKPDTDTAQDMAIDGSVYILLKNGAILKYTRGEKDAFAITALQKPLSNPTKIVTTEEGESLYVLDNGNARVVSFDKNGTFKNAYATPLAARAKGIAVNNTETKLYLLSGDKIYELAL